MTRLRWFLAACVGFLAACGAATQSATPASALPSPSGSFCTVDLTFGEGIIGHVTGSRNGRARYTAGNVGISLFMKIPDVEGFMDLKVFNLEKLWVSLGRTDTGDLGLWNNGMTSGTAMPAPDGSSATIDATAGGASTNAPVHIAGTITCPPAPPAATLSGGSAS